jgi:hypothetical protein
MLFLAVLLQLNAARKANNGKSNAEQQSNELNDATQTLKFWPPNVLNLNETSKGNYYQIALVQKPAGIVKVFSSGPNLRFKDKFKTFTVDNWNEPQYVFVRASPMWSSASQHTIQVTNRIFHTERNWVDALYSISREVIPGKHCYSWGDPHIEMFNAIRLDYHVPMNQTLFSNKDFDVQQTQLQCQPWNNAMCGFALAIRYGSSVFTIDTKKSDIYFNSR